MNIKQKVITLALALSSLLVISSSLTPVALADCGEAKTSVINCATGSGTTAKDSAIWQVLLIILNIMTAGIGILAVGGIVYGSIMYASAGDKADQTKKAIEVITNVVIGIVAYGLMYVVINFLIPGGLFN
ncbi:MAG TPA: hypothetical protein VK502_02260 [Candidatus Saccharimonadales bacterium]|nr:hypothetical protein [Candidatus Saccharimonadales bacterium]